MRLLAAALIVALLAVSVGAAAYVVTRPTPQGFNLTVYPTELRGSAIAGQMVVLLATAADNESGKAGGAVKLAASAPGASISVQPESLSPGQVGEIAVIPRVESVGKNITVTVTGERGGLTTSRTVSFTVYPGEYTDDDRARQVRDAFVQWLQTSHPELGITNQTQWVGTVVSPHWLVVSHFLFFSADWEMHVYWHVMIPPYDWARIDLRHRGTEMTPSSSFEIASMSAGAMPQEVTPPESTWR